MTRATEVSPDTRAIAWREAWQHLRARSKRLIPFASGVTAALLGVYLYTALNPPAESLTLTQVNDAVAEAMAAATPAPAYSAQVYRVIQPSLVLIETQGADETDTEHDGLGSGVVISDQGVILTALHVVDGAADITVTFADGTETEAQVVSSQPEKDIAVIQPAELPELLVPAVLGNPNAMRIGDEAYAVGNPFGLYGSLSSGVISGFDRFFRDKDSGRSIEGLMQIDTAVNPGNSGGPLLNRYGQVVGIVVGVLNPTEQEFFVGIGFAVPITVAAGGAGAPPY
jgi:S1-C subfamily serine protease